MKTEIAVIVDRMHTTLERSQQIEAFVFGSAIHVNGTHNDIDIMVIYSDPFVPATIREMLKDVFYTPIHLIFLTPQEELETDFIRKQGCISIFRTRIFDESARRGS